MELKNINLNLRRAIQENQRDALELSPWQIAGFLEVCRRSLHDHVRNANEQLGINSEAYIPLTELEKIDSIFRELTDNFFPMAHSNEPLRDLQIVDKEKLRRVQNLLLHLNDVWRQTHELSEDLAQSIERLINP
jgi:hypothetical protein